MPNPAPSEDELFIHLDTAGLAALMKAIEAAMTDGRGHLTLGRGMVVTGRRSPRPFGKATVTFTAADASDDDWRTGGPAPEPLPRRPVLELQD